MKLQKKLIVFLSIFISSITFAEELNKEIKNNQLKQTKLETNKYCYYEGLKYSKGAVIRSKVDNLLECKKSKDSKELIWVKK
ncbi:MAG: YnjH family protein [Colwellia sp.]